MARAVTRPKGPGMPLDGPRPICRNKVCFHGNRWQIGWHLDILSNFQGTVILHSILFIDELRPDDRVSGETQYVEHSKNMSTKLYVGNLPFDVTEDDLRTLFSQQGPVNEIALIMDRATGRARGFGFVTMNTPEAAAAAIQGLNGKDLRGRALTVNEARAREEGPRGGGYGGGGRPR
jgi:cold-inducible RNA-binding protein